MKTFFLTAAFAAISFISFSQTSMLEYNYVTMGYKTTLEQGLDIKAGYTVTDLSGGPYYFTTNTAYKLQAFALTRNGQPVNNYAAIMVVYKYQDKIQQVFCIPHPNTTDAEVLNKANKEIINMSGSIRDLYLTMMSKMYAKEHARK